MATPGGASLIRNYSLSNAPGSAEYRISVKREPHGAGSGYIHSQVRVGGSLDVAAPRGAFFLIEGEGPVLLTSAGVGVTPVLSMLYSLAQSGVQREVWWLYGAHDGVEHPFAKECRSLLDELPGSHSHVVYSSPMAADREGVDFDGQGRLTADVVGALGVPPTADAYLCGPAAFMEQLSSGLRAYGLAADRVHMETFGAAAALTPGIAARSVPPHLPAGPPGHGPEVQFARSAISAPWGPPSTSILEFAETCDVPTRWSCRTGVCHNCETALLSGSVSYDPEPLEPPADGNILICCSRPAEALVVDL
jgi:ferredoxin-NADP reductase